MDNNSNKVNTFAFYLFGAAAAATFCFVLFRFAFFTLMSSVYFSFHFLSCCCCGGGGGYCCCSLVQTNYFCCLRFGWITIFLLLFLLVVFWLVDLLDLVHDYNLTRQLTSFTLNRHTHTFTHRDAHTAGFGTLFFRDTNGFAVCVCVCKITCAHTFGGAANHNAVLFLSHTLCYNWSKYGIISRVSQCACVHARWQSPMSVSLSLSAHPYFNRIPMYVRWRSFIIYISYHAYAEFYTMQTQIVTHLFEFFSFNLSCRFAIRTCVIIL